MRVILMSNLVSYWNDHRTKTMENIESGFDCIRHWNLYFSNKILRWFTAQRKRVNCSMARTMKRTKFKVKGSGAADLTKTLQHGEEPTMEISKRNMYCIYIRKINGTFCSAAEALVSFSISKSVTKPVCGCWPSFWLFQLLVLKILLLLWLWNNDSLQQQL